MGGGLPTTKVLRPVIFKADAPPRDRLQRSITKGPGELPAPPSASPNPRQPSCTGAAVPLGLLLLAGASRRAKGEAHLSEPAAELERQLELIKRELGEARAQQAATSEILKVISRSAFGLRSVLQTLVESAVRLCATDGLIYLRQGDLFVAEA